jgi:hypothetical protein
VPGAIYTPVKDTAGNIVSYTVTAKAGASNCVPRVPVGPNFTSTACGNIMEAMKYEKRLETQFTGFVQWYVDERGWGDLVQNSGYQFPVPYQEMDARLHPFYSLGGGLPSSSGPSTYGY